MVLAWGRVRGGRALLLWRLGSRMGQRIIKVDKQDRPFRKVKCVNMVRRELGGVEVGRRGSGSVGGRVREGLFEGESCITGKTSCARTRRKNIPEGTRTL